MSKLLSPENQAATGNRAAVARYRKKHRRLDYVPSAAALAVIEDWLAKGLSDCFAGVLDRLVVEGHEKMTGHSPGGAP